MAHLVVVVLVSICARVANSIRAHCDASIISEPVQKKPALPDINLPQSELYANGSVWIAKDTSGVYEHLLKSMLKKRAQTDGVEFQANQTLEALRSQQIDYVKGLYSSFLCDTPVDAPTVFFVLGYMAVGKSSFIEKSSFPDSTVHVNHDDIRSLLVGNYEVFRQTKLVAKSDRQMIIDDAKVVRAWVVDQAIERKCNFLRDAFIVGAPDVKQFVNQRYAVNVYYLEVGFKGSNYTEGGEDYFVKKAQITRDRIQGRMEWGGHGNSCPIADDAIANLRRDVEKLAIELNLLEPPVPINFYISQEGGYDHRGSLASLVTSERYPFL